jgi:hypothetical protein
MQGVKLGQKGFVSHTGTINLSSSLYSITMLGHGGLFRSQHSRRLFSGRPCRPKIKFIIVRLQVLTASRTKLIAFWDTYLCMSMPTFHRCLLPLSSGGCRCCRHCKQRVNSDICMLHSTSLGAKIAQLLEKIVPHLL